MQLKMFKTISISFSTLSVTSRFSSFVLLSTPFQVPISTLFKAKRASSTTCKTHSSLSTLFHLNSNYHLDMPVHTRSKSTKNSFTTLTTNADVFETPRSNRPNKVTLSSKENSHDDEEKKSNVNDDEDLSFSEKLNLIKKRGDTVKQKIDDIVIKQNGKTYYQLTNNVTVTVESKPKKKTTKRNEIKQLKPEPEDISSNMIVTPSPQIPNKLNSSTPRKRSNSKTPAKKRTPSRKRVRTEQSLPKSEEQQKQPLPKDFHEIYKLVKELREDKNAPVDSDGPQALAETHLGEKVYRFQILISLMLSSQTKDAMVGEAIRGLQKHGLNVQNIHSNTTSEQLNKFIYKVGFRNNKTKYIKQVCEILIEKYDGDIPPGADEMIQDLPGVGPKMAYIIESIAWNKSTGIGVDTHMHRIFNELKWVKSKTAEQTRVQLEAFLPHEYWNEINYLFVGLGQQAQQQKEVILKKAIQCSQPYEALRLLKKLQLDYVKEAKKFGLVDEVNVIMQNKS